MRIGIDCRLWNQTGVGRYLRELVYHLAEIDKDNQYLLFFRREEFENLEPPGPNFKKKLADIRWHSFGEQIFLPYILFKEHLDLVHFPYFSVPIFYPGKFVLTIHDLIIDHFATGQASTLPIIFYKIKRLAYKYVVWWALHRAAKVITVSQSTKKEIVDHYKIDPGKIIVTYEAFA
jgi:glycosyltransferase involved in cell wall biosynthesis